MVDPLAVPSTRELWRERSSCHMTASVNYFFRPFYRKGSDLRHFTFDSFYRFLDEVHEEGGAKAEALLHRSRWRRNLSSE